MTLLNSLLALGALAFTVPLAIHLLFRSRYRTVDWGAMHLLNSVVRVNRRRLQLLQILLLLLRCLLPVLLAVCLARPLLTGWQALPGNTPESLVLVIDDSRSMSAAIEGDGSRMDRAKRLAVDLLSELQRSDEVFLFAASQNDRPASRSGHQQAILQLNAIRPDAAAVSLDRVMQHALRSLERASYPNQRVVIVSDFQAINVNDGTGNALRRLGSRLEEAAVRPAISWLDVTGSAASPPNLFVQSIEVQSPSVVAGRRATYESVIRNESDQLVTEIPVVWSIDGTPLRPVKVSLEPQSSATTRLEHTIEEAGSHRVSVALQSSDPLIADNQRTIGLQVIEQVQVLLVDGKPRRQKLQSETDFLAIALSPFAFGGEEQPDAVRTKAIRVSALSAAFDADSPDVVVLANVRSLDKAMRDRLADFVAMGGALIVFDGDQVDSDAYNQPWGESQSWRLPARLGLIEGNPDANRSGNDVSDDGTTSRFEIAGDRRDYAPWQRLIGSGDSPFSAVDVFAYRQLNVDYRAPSAPPAADRAAQNIKGTKQDTQVLLQFTSGDPLAVMASRGQGKVVQFAIPCDADWTNLPMQLVYLPMVQQLVLDLAGSRKDLTVGVDQVVRVAADEFEGMIQKGQTAKGMTGVAGKPDRSEPKVLLRGPDGSEQTIEVSPGSEGSTGVEDLGGREPSLQFVTSAGPGLYRLLFQPDDPNAENVSNETIRVAQVPGTESRLRSISDDRLKSLADSIGAAVYRDVTSLQQADQTRRFGREVWRWFLMLLLIAMLAELFVQQRQARAAVWGAV